MTIKKHTRINLREAISKLDDELYYVVTGEPRILLREYVECLQRIEIQQQQSKPNLLNPQAPESPDWLRVHQLVEDITYERLDQRLKDKVAELESRLIEAGVLQ